MALQPHPGAAARFAPRSRVLAAANRTAAICDQLGLVAAEFIGTSEEGRLADIYHDLRTLELELRLIERAIR